MSRLLLNPQGWVFICDVSSFNSVPEFSDVFFHLESEALQKGVAHRSGGDDRYGLLPSAAFIDLGLLERLKP